MLRFLSEDYDTELPTAYAIPYQRVNDIPGPDVLVDGQRLLPLHLLPDFDHVAFHVMTTEEESISAIASQAKRRSCKGVIISYSRSSFPVARVPSLADLHISVPVVIVQKHHGDELLRRLSNSSQPVTVSILKETPSAENFLECWDSPTTSGGFSRGKLLADTGETMPRKTDGLVTRLRELIYNPDKTPARVCLDAQRMQNILKLFEDYSRSVKQWSLADRDQKLTSNLFGSLVSSVLLEVLKRVISQTE